MIVKIVDPFSHSGGTLSKLIHKLKIAHVIWLEVDNSVYKLTIKKL